MSQSAANLVDRIMPHAPVRQFVLTVPVALRFKLCYDHELLGQVLRIFLRTVFSWMRRTAKHYLGLDSVKELTCGSVTHIQRARDDLAVSPHFHALVIDGIFIDRGYDVAPEFRAIPGPTKKDLLHITKVAWRRTRRLFDKLGLLEQYVDTFAEEEPLLAGCAGASVQNRIASGKRRGQRVKRIRTSPPSPRRRLDVLAIEYRGFNLHAGVRIPAHDRKRLERLARYAARGPIASSRLEMLDDGTLLYRLKRLWDDGTTAISMTAHELLDRVVPLIPRPYTHLVRFHGVLAPHANHRPHIVPASAVAANEDDEQGDGRSPGGWIPWADLLKRVFLEDVTTCPACGGRMSIVAVIMNREAARKILEKHGLPPDPPTRGRVRSTNQEPVFGDIIPGDDGWEAA